MNFGKNCELYRLNSNSLIEFENYKFQNNRLDILELNGGTYDNLYIKNYVYNLCMKVYRDCDY